MTLRYRTRLVRVSSVCHGSSTPAKLFGSITVQVEVNDTGGPVTISEIVVNGAGAEAGSNVSFSDSPGVLDRVSLFEALNSGVTVSGTPAVTIDKSSIQVPPSGAGISVTDETSTVTIANNYIHRLRPCSCTETGIFAQGSDVTIMGNTIQLNLQDSVDSTAIMASSGTNTITGNNISNVPMGILIRGGTMDIRGNVFNNFVRAVQIASIGSLTFRENIMNSTADGAVGFAMRCKIPSPLVIGGNTFINLDVAVEQVATGLFFPDGIGTYTGVQSVEQFCP